MTQNYVGVDLSKDFLDIYDPVRGASRVANTGVTVRRFLRSLSGEDFLIFEGEAIPAIGPRGGPNAGCDRGLREACAKGGTAYARINPLHGWHYAQSLNLAKTDRLDARMLARLGAERRPEPTPPDDPARAELGVLNQRRDQLKRMETQEKNRLSGCAHQAVKCTIKASLKVLATQVRDIDALIAAHLQAHPKLGAQARLLQTIPGIGKVTSTELLAHLSQLGQIDRRAVASLGGLAPKARDSGKFYGKRALGPGRRHVRKALYMAAMNALRHKGPFNNTVARMRAAGKAPKVIIVALARKLLTIANAILRTGQPFRTHP